MAPDRLRLSSKAASTLLRADVRSASRASSSLSCVAKQKPQKPPLISLEAACRADQRYLSLAARSKAPLEPHVFKAVAILWRI